MGRVPRNGWKLISDLCSQRFMISMTVADAKASKNKTPSAKRRRVHGTPELSQDTQSQGTNCDISLLKQVRVAFLRHLEANRETEMQARVLTRKIPQRKVDEEMLIGLNMVLAQVAREKAPETLDEISLLLYTAQTAYQELTYKVRPPSPWKTNILAKIAKCESERECLMEHVSNLENKKKGGMSKEVRKILRREGAKIWDVNDIKRAKVNIEERSNVYRRKIESHESRVSFRRANDLFEFNRRMFYRRLHEEPRPEGTQTDEEMAGFWAKMWEKQETDECFEDLISRQDLLTEQDGISEVGRKLREIIERLPNWKTPGVDKVFNFFIKKCTALHDHLIAIVDNILKQPEGLPRWFYTGTTYLIPKAQSPTSPSEYRPITCMTNLYKVVTRLVARELRDFVEVNGILSENQLGTVRDSQGAKEQALINKCVNQSNGNTLSTMWIDVKKAYDSVKHEYLLTCLEKLGVPGWCIVFITAVVQNWRVQLNYNRKVIAEVGLERGILQGDSMSPLLFVLCLEPLSRKLNKAYETVPIEEGERWYSTNHLLFIDDIKLLARSENTLEAMAGTTKAFLQRTGLEINPSKSATNVQGCRNVTKYLEEHEGYKYLGVLEDRHSIIQPETKTRIVEGMRSRVRRICATKLNARHMIQAINEHAISPLNYYVGLVEFEPVEYEEMDREIRGILKDERIHYQPGNKERLYMPRSQLGRGLTNVVFKSERMLLAMNNFLEQRKDSCKRKAAIMAVERERATHLGTIKSYLKEKYNLDEVEMKELVEKQKEKLEEKTNAKCLHSKVLRALKEPQVDTRASSLWLTHGNLSMQEEGALCYLQDRNVFFTEIGAKCGNCGKEDKTVDHIATHCEKLREYEYVWRHNEVVKSIHLHYCNRYGIVKSTRRGAHKVESVIENGRVCIKSDVYIRTDLKLSHNKPDIVVHDKEKNEMIIVEVGITSLERLQEVEIAKARKYGPLAAELKRIYGCKVTMIPYVMTWDGMVTSYHKRYQKEIGIGGTLRPTSRL